MFRSSPNGKKLFIDQMKRLFFIIIILTASLAAGLYLYRYDLMRRAKFNIVVLADYLRAYLFLHPEPLNQLSDLPDFDIISPQHSLGLKAGEIRRGTFKGYAYHLQMNPDGTFYMTASPQGIFSPSVEYAATNSGALLMNTKGVDVEADSWEEIRSWQVIEHQESYRSRQLPEYLR